MEIGNEISHKIRSAIKAKLVELGAYEDEELPDYIMVMVANKKTHAQMNEDLHLFLGGSTEKFTLWLQTILNKLKSITIGNPAVMNAVVSREVEDTNNSNNNDDTGVPELLVQTDMDEFAVEQEENNLLSSVEKSSSVHPVAETLKMNSNLSSVDTAPTQPFKVQLQSSTHYINPKLSANVMSQLQQAMNSNQNQHQPSSDTATSGSMAPGYPSNKQLPPRLHMDLIPNYSNKQIPKIVADPLSSQPQTDINLAKVRPQNRKRRIPGSVIGSVIHHSSDEEEYDPYNPSYGSVASVVRVTERKSSIPPSLQANKCLLMKAVKDAHKSLEKQEKKIVEKAFIKPMPNEVPEKRIKLSERMQQRRLMMFTQRQKANDLMSYEAEAEDSYEAMDCDEDDYDLDLVGGDSRLVECKQRPSRIAVLKQPPQITTPTPLQGRLNLVSRSELDNFLQESIDSAAADSSNLEKMEPDSPSPLETHSSRIVKDKKRPESKTQFIVTLDGFDESQISKSSVPSSSVQSSPEDNSMETTHLPVTRHRSLRVGIGDPSEDKEIVRQKKSTAPEKIAENCRFWPSCQNGNNCKYQHPSVACSKFPNCKFGDTCAYMHPKCKFDTKCNRFDCVYSHNHSRSSASMPPVAAPLPTPPPPPPTPPVVPAAPATVPTHLRPPCKFFPSCKNMSCPFNHPKPCRFGISCGNKAFCTFYHPPLPKAKQLRWKADKSLMSDDAANFAALLEMEFEQGNNPYKVVNTVNR